MLAFSEEQRALAEGIARFLAEGRRSWAELAAFGLVGLTVPQAAGGLGGGAREVFLAARAAGAVALAEPLAEAAFLPGLLLGEGAEATALAAGTTRFAAVTAPAAEGAVLPAVAGADAADALLLPVAGALWLIDLAADPSARTPRPLIDGVGAAALRLTPALLAARRRLPVDGAALARATRFARLAAAAEAAGAAEAAVAETARYLTERRQFGQPLASFQALRHRLVDAMVAAEEIHAAALSAAVAVEREAPEADRILAAALLKAATAGRRVAEEAVQLHGGVGVTEEYRVSHLHRRLMRLALAFGGAAAHRAALRDA